MSNPLLDELDIHTVEISLPTGGLFYEDDVLGTADPERIKISPIGIIAEQAYRDPLLLASGRGLPMMLHHVCPDIIKPEELAEVDIDLILLTTRMLSYGNDMILDHVCEECEETNQIKVDIQKFILKYDPVTLGLADIDSDFGIPPDYIFPVEETGQTVILRPMSYFDTSRAIVKSFEIQQQYDDMNGSEDKAIDMSQLLSKSMMDQYNDIVDISTESGVDSLVANIHFIRTKSGQDVFNMDDIREWILHLNTKIIERMQEQIRELSDKLRKISDVKYKCIHCEHDNEMFLQLDPQRLFNSAAASSTQTVPSDSLKTTAKKKKKPPKTSQR